ncbi:MAG TPA: hypothetical protein PKW35_13065 [Nannocystaceae bacterium]|nr:hypothetical protein [Nannocystaceae bacterium]
MSACASGQCIDGVGCVDCIPGQYTCRADKVLHCPQMAQYTWQILEDCDPAMGQGCDLAAKACVELKPVGGVAPTGVYYQFADFSNKGGVFKAGYDVDGWGDRLYVTRNGGIDVYRVELLDSDGDGLLEPNQHPDNPDAPGPIETRQLFFVEELPPFGPDDFKPAATELFAVHDRLYRGGGQITEYGLGNGVTQTSAPMEAWAVTFSHIGYDEVNGLWYASNETARRVFQYDPAFGSWGIAFVYPELAGGHMDGLEVVVDPKSGTPYVYVSDMTSDFIGQYRFDPVVGWVQENLFGYAGTQGAAVEGMGFGPLGHFWATSGATLYEIGGGDLANYTEPPG